MIETNESADEKGELLKVATRHVPDMEVLERPRRRTYTAKYKLEVLKKAEACSQPGQIGALLRKEGLYHSRLTEWRRQREAGALKGLSQHRGPKVRRNPMADAHQRLEREIVQLHKKLEQAEQIIEIQKKISELMGSALKSPASSGSD